MRKISKNSPVPMYYQIKELIIEMIENEELKLEIRSRRKECFANNTASAG
jgi:DNA-binding transcriptional regulator YhcF (GntR family)